MHPGPSESPASPQSRPPILLIGGGILVMALGFGLPRLVPLIMPATPSVSGAAPSQSEPKPQPPPPLPDLSSASSTNPEPQPAGPGLGLSLAKMIFGLVVVSGLCIAITRGLNRRAPQVSGKMQVLASLRVDARCVVHLVRAGDRRLLIGTDLNGVKALTELPAKLPELIEPAELEVATTGAAAPASDARTVVVPAKSVVVGPVAVPIAPMPPAPPPAAPSEPASGPPASATSVSREEVLAVLDRLLKTVTQTHTEAGR